MDVIRDDDRPELQPPILQGLGQAVPQVDPPLALRARRAGIDRGQGVRAVRRPARPAAWQLATAASFALAVGLGLYTSQLRGRITVLEDELRDTRSRERRRSASGRCAADRGRRRRSLAVLTAPDVARIDLAGQPPVAPRASARAFWSRSRGMVFTASNLPPLPAGSVYQLWVVTKEPAPLSAGLLTPDVAGQRQRNHQHAGRHSAAGRTRRHHRAGRRKHDTPSARNILIGTL